MAHARVKSGLRDVSTGILTPFDDDLAIDHDALAENARTLYEQGIRTFLAAANVSEYHSLSPAERIAVTETSVAALPDDSTILAGAGGDTATAIDLAKAHEAAGVDAIMVMPPDHTYKHERGLLRYYRKIGDAVDVPLVPYVRNIDPSVEFVADITRLDDVVGVKWTLEDIPKFAQSVEAGSDDVVWINGLGEPYAVSMHYEGADGQTSGIGSFEPAIALALDEALNAGELDRARAVRDAALPLMEIRKETGDRNRIPIANSIPVVKAALEFAGLHGGPVREPLVELSETDRERTRDLYEDLDDFISSELDDAPRPRS